MSITTTRGEALSIVIGPLGIPQIAATSAYPELPHSFGDGHPHDACVACRATRAIALPAGPSSNGGTK